MKGRGNRPIEALATLYFKEGAKFYLILMLSEFWTDKQHISKSFYFPDDIYI